MKKLIIMLLFPLSGMAQGIHFEQNLSWPQVQAKAKAEHKYIFMDCYATWCVPCKYMSENIFTQPAVGTFVNENFISVSVQMDSTAKDNDFVKSGYADAKKLVNDYQVNSYPTYLFFDPDGHIIHRAGGSMPQNAFMEVVKDALNPDKQFYPLYNKYKQGDRDSSLLWQLTLGSVNTGDTEFTSKLLADYIDHAKNIYAKDNLELIGKLTKTSKEKGFDIWFHHTAQVDQVMFKDYAERKVINTIMNEDRQVIDANQKAAQGLIITATIGDQPIYGGPDKSKEQPVTPDWAKMYNGIKAKFGIYYADRITKWVKMNYYKTRQDWTGYNLALVSYMDTYQETIIKPAQLNELAWNIFTHSSDKKQLEAATNWSKASVTLSEKDPNLNQYIDTYANLLYKTGNKTAAIAQEEKALQLSTSEQDKGSMAATLEKMKKGEKIEVQN